MNKFVIACMMYLAVVSMASAGYTDSLWNESEDRVYYDCGDWSGVDNHKDTSFGSNYYGYSRHRNNGRYMSDPTNWGYPSNAELSRGVFDNIAWTCIHINGFDKTLYVEGDVYTDDPSEINYKTSYLAYSGWHTMHWLIYDITSDVAISDNGDKITTTNTIVFYAENGDDEMQKTRTPTDGVRYKTLGAPDRTIGAELINHSNYMILNLPTPANVTGIKIAATSRNTTAIYEKHTHCLKLNTSKSFITCDLVDYKYHNFTEITPFGYDSYLLQYEPDYDINVTLYTPFELIDAVVYINETEAEPINTDLKYDTVWNLLYIAVPISLIIGLTRLI